MRREARRRAAEMAPCKHSANELVVTPSYSPARGGTGWHCDADRLASGLPLSRPRRGSASGSTATREGDRPVGISLVPHDARRRQEPLLVPLSSI